MHERVTALYFLVAMFLPMLVHSEDEQVCSDFEVYHQLDFWVGEWEVVDRQGALQGHNRIEKILNGCVVFENWTSANGSEGKSWFYLDPVNQSWKQVWVTEQGNQPGGTKEKLLIESFAGGAVRFQGKVLYGEVFMYDRTTLTPMENGYVEQHIQVSKDGDTWEDGWIGIYRPVK